MESEKNNASDRQARFSAPRLVNDFMSFGNTENQTNQVNDLETNGSHLLEYTFESFITHLSSPLLVLSYEGACHNLSVALFGSGS